MASDWEIVKSSSDWQQVQPQEQQGATGGALDVLTGAGKFLLPQTTKTLTQEAPNLMRTMDQNQPKNRFDVPGSIVAAAKDTGEFAKMMFNPQQLAEIASTVPAMKGVGLLKKAVIGGGQGLAQGYAAGNDPISMGVGTLLGAGNPLINKGVTALLKGVGKSAMGNIIKPLTKNQPGWSDQKKQAMNALAEHTGFTITPEQIDKKITNKMSQITKDIKGRLSQYDGKKNFDINNLLSNLEEHLKSNVAGYVSPEVTLKSAGRSQQSKPEHDMVSQLGTLISKYAVQGVGEKSGKLKTAMSPLNLFKLKQEWGNILNGSGVWNKLDPSVADNTGKAIYGYLKDALTNNIDPTIAKQTELEHQLYNVSHGTYQAGNRTQDMSGGIGSIISGILGMKNPLQMAAGRGLYNAGKLNESQPVQDILQQFGIRLPNMVNQQVQ